MVQTSTEVKKFINEHIFPGSIYDEDFISKNFILINTTEDAGLARIPAKDEGAAGITSITDRGKLAELFKWLVENDSLYKIAVCDLKFSDSSIVGSADSTLQKYIKLLLRKEKPKIIFAGQFEGNAFEKSIFEDINQNPGLTGNTHYTNRGGGFIEYTLSSNNNTVKSLPLLLYEKVNGNYVSDGRLLKIGDREGPMGLIKLNKPDGHFERVWNTFTPEILFDNESIDSLVTFENSVMREGKLPSKIRLGTAAEEGYLSYLCSSNRQKIIFIGAFGGGHNDTHETLYGQTDGSVILLNIYYSLATGKNSIKGFFLLFLFFIFFLIAIDIVFTGYFNNIFYYIVCITLLLGIPKILLDALGLISGVFKTASKEYVKWLKEESRYFILIITAIIANVFFNRIINIVIIALAILILHKLFRYLYGKKARQFEAV
ncbi:hypothetical protein GCM10027043_05350 [Ferruginibacter profundus]